MPIRNRITLISAALTALVLVATGFFLVARLKADFRNVIDEELDTRSDLLVVGGDTPPQEVKGRQERIEDDEAFAQVVSRDGTVVRSSLGLLRRPILPVTVLRDLKEPRIFETTVGTEEEPVHARLLAAPSGPDRVVIVGTSLEHPEETLAALIPLLWIGGPAALAVVSLVIWFLTGVALRPVERMRTQAEALSASEPSRRLPVPKTHDEIARLGETFNSFLDRLEDSLERERRFVDDASHELRTPLAVLKAEIELALRRSRTPEELEAALRSAAEEADILSRMADDLLVLARADRGLLPVSRSDVDVSDLASQLGDAFGARASERGVGIAVRAEDRPVVRADPLRVRQAISNLLDNAIRHTPAGGTVTVAVVAEDGAALVDVLDTGPGFSPVMLAAAFDPFVRDDAARSRADGGAGLGLSIVRAVVEAHGGSVVAQNRPEGGGWVRIRLPR